MPVDVITLEVTPEEGEKLALAATEGKIQLALRNCKNTELIPTKGITIPDLLASYTDSNSRAVKPPMAIAASPLTGGGEVAAAGARGKGRPPLRVRGRAKHGREDEKKGISPPPPPPRPIMVELIKGERVSEVIFESGQRRETVKRESNGANSKKKE